MHIAFLLTGGNSGDRERYLLEAKQKIVTNCGTLLSASAIYETAAWGLENQPVFYNQALKITTDLTAPELLKQVLSIEESLGRVRQVKYGPRTIDIDILFFYNLILELPDLKIPHPELHNRRFALQCLVEIAPELMHPVLGKSVRQLLEDCNDKLAVKRVL